MNLFAAVLYRIQLVASKLLAYTNLSTRAHQIATLENAGITEPLVRATVARRSYTTPDRQNGWHRNLLPVTPIILTDKNIASDTENRRYS